LHAHQEDKDLKDFEIVVLQFFMVYVYDCYRLFISSLVIVWLS